MSSVLGIIFLSCLFAALVLWVLFREKRRELSGETNANSAVSVAASVINTVNSQWRDGSNTSAIPAIGIRPQQSNISLPREAQMRATVERMNVPVNFYGRVVDQDGNSLAGVRIDVRVRHWDLTSLGASIPLKTETDSDGRFHVQGVTGDALRIELVAKAGYELEPYAQRSFGAVGGSQSEPVVFKLWSSNTREQLVTGKRSFRIIPDGRAYGIDLTKGTIAESEEGDLRVRIKYPQATVRGQTYDWLSEITVTGGLSQEVDAHSSMYSAPVSGYTNTFRYDQQIKGGQYGSTGKQRFYFRLNNGPKYGRIEIELYAPYNDQIPGLIRLDFVLNPSGSRILR